MTTRRFSEAEDALVAMHRALVEYQNERTRFDNTLDEAKPDDEVYVELHTDGSGFLVVDPEDPNEATTRPATWHDIHEARPAIDRLTRRLIEEREAREQRTQRSRPGDPRRGRRRPA